MVGANRMDWSEAMSTAFSSPTDWSHERSWRPEPQTVRQSRGFVAAHLSQHAITEIAADVTLVVSELATNAVCHAQTSYEVTLRQSGSALRIEVRDSSPGSVRVSDRPASDTTGRGLVLVGAISDSWGVAPVEGGKVVWASFELGHELQRRSAEHDNGSPSVPRVPA